jgi:nucleotide-binding universal stress UspA family protein
MTDHAAPTVIVGVDGSDQSADALALALKLLEPLGARLWPLFVHPYGPLSGTLPESRYQELVNELADSVHAQLKALEVPAAERRLQIVTDRSAAAGLQRIAEQDAAAMIVVGGSRRSRLGRVLPGGTAERLLDGAPCPVAVAPREYARNADEIVFVGCAFDGSAESRQALDWAASLARSVEAQFRLLGVHQPLPPARVRDPNSLELASVNQKLREEFGRRLDEAATSVREGHMKVTSALLDGDPASQIARASEHLDLLVLGSRGYGPFGAVVLGSVSNALVRTARCPVVVIPRSSTA